MSGSINRDKPISHNCITKMKEYKDKSRLEI